MDDVRRRVPDGVKTAFTMVANAQLQRSSPPHPLILLNPFVDLSVHRTPDTSHDSCLGRDRRACPIQTCMPIRSSDDDMSATVLCQSAGLMGRVNRFVYLVYPFSMCMRNVV
jgi:hypothetical protein